jgi:hypothetical protein
MVLMLKDGMHTKKQWKRMINYNTHPRTQWLLSEVCESGVALNIINYGIQ